jgi:hypothetical protein
MDNWSTTPNLLSVKHKMLMNRGQPRALYQWKPQIKNEMRKNEHFFCFELAGG